MKRSILTFFAAYLVSLTSIAQSNVEHTAADQQLVIHYYEPAPKQNVDRLSQVLSASLSFYIDEHFSIVEDKLIWKKKESDILKDLNGIVKSAIKYYDYKEINAFKGFSDDVKHKIEVLGALDFKSSQDFSKQMTEAEIQRKRYYFFQKEINDLKLMIDVEVGNFNNDNLLVKTESTSTVVPDGTIDSLLNDLEYNSNAFLKPHDIKLNDASMTLLSVEDNSTLGNDSLPQTIGTSEFEKAILQLLQTNTAQLSMMQVQIDELKSTQIAMLEERQNERNQELQMQIDDLRTMVVELARINTGNALASNDGSTYSPEIGGADEEINLPESISIPFEKGSVKLSAGGKLALNEVVDILARNPGLKLMITGMADKSGNAMDNLVISQERASEVRKFMKASGLAESRFVMKYYGDSKSEGESANDRKVLLEFIR
jgi:outer membrane protein OmpA-like peptidoglycan-associated protein